jgi:multidrug efflux pump subunit AcrA (membrane-fusion protein)
MSAIVNPSPTPVQVPQPGAPQPVPATPEKPSRKRWILLAIAVAVVVVGLSYLLRPKLAEKSAVPSMRTAKVERGVLRGTVRLAGTTSAKNYANIAAPMMRGPDAGRSLVLIRLANAGSFVKKGDLVAEIDPQAIKDHVADLGALIEQAQADVRKAKADMEIQLETQRQTIRQANADLEKAKLDAGAAPIRSDIDKEELKLSVGEAEAVYKASLQDLKTLEMSQKAQIRVLDLTRERHTRHHDRHQVDVTRFTIHAPLSGLVVMTTVWRGGDMGQVQQGDQVSPGQPFMKIVDVASMQLEATINQTESEGLRLGMPAEINFDAFPDLHLHGKVEAVGALAVGGWRQNYYIRNIPVRIALQQTDSRVIPDLSASADVLLTHTNALIVPRESVIDERGATVVYVKQGDHLARREVRIGPQNNTQSDILEGVSAGEEVVLQKPAAPATLKAGQ